jgi:hypothetical protein
MWPFKSRFQRNVEQSGRAFADGMAEGIREQQARVDAGLPMRPISPEALDIAGEITRRSFPDDD